MPTSFFDLPREIRDIIYKHALLSPTGSVKPFSYRRSRPLRFSISPVLDLDDEDDSTSFDSSNDVLSVSLQRTCRQIHLETLGLFWSNIFVFHDPSLAPIVIKSMGQIASRQMRSLSVAFDPLYWKSLPKLFALLTSRARHGCFETLRLDLPKYPFRLLVDLKAEEGTRYDEMLEMLRDISKECSFQRSFRVEWGVLTDNVLEVDTIRDLALAFGGKFAYEGKVLWDNYEYVGRKGEA